MVARSLAVAVLALVLLVAAPARAADGNGWLRVKSSPGVRIFVDGKFRGVTAEPVQGLVVDRLAPGAHVVVAEKVGFRPVEVAVHVHQNMVSEVEAQPFELLLPDPKTSEEREGPKEGSTAFGGLIIQSLPDRMIINAPLLEWQKIEKTSDEWSADVPEGTYRLTFFAADYERLDFVAKIRAGRDLYLMVDFLERRVIELQAQGREPGGPRVDQREACIEGASSMSAQSWPSPGWLTIDARPHADVFQETRKLGETPLAHAILPAGCVRLRLVEVESKKQHERFLWVEPNQDLAYRCPLDQVTCVRPEASP